MKTKRKKYTNSKDRLFNISKLLLNPKKNTTEITINSPEVQRYKKLINITDEDINLSEALYYKELDRILKNNKGRHREYCTSENAKQIIEVILEQKVETKAKNYGYKLKTNIEAFALLYFMFKENNELDLFFESEYMFNNYETIFYKYHMEIDDILMIFEELNTQNDKGFIARELKEVKEQYEKTNLEIHNTDFSKITKEELDETLKYKMEKYKEICSEYKEEKNINEFIKKRNELLKVNKILFKNKKSIEEQIDRFKNITTIILDYYFKDKLSENKNGLKNTLKVIKKSFENTKISPQIISNILVMGDIFRNVFENIYSKEKYDKDFSKKIESNLDFIFLMSKYDKTGGK